MVINVLNNTFVENSKFSCLKPIVSSVKNVIILTKSYCFGTLRCTATVINAGWNF